MTDTAEPTRMMPGCHTLRDARGVVLIQGEYDPQHMFAILSAGDPAYWRGKRVLDVGANTCGLSVEIARAGAAEVIALEPDAYTNSLVDVEDVLRRLKEEENLPFEWRRASLFEAAQFGRFDTILALGLVYHFRDPQYVLDFISTLDIQDLFVSTNTVAGEEFSMRNRRDLAGTDLPRDFFSAAPWTAWENMPGVTNGEGIILTGWHPTHALFERMIRWAGFDNVVSLTDPTISLSNMPRSWRSLTNSAYFKATKARMIDPDASRRVYYPR